MNTPEKYVVAIPTYKRAETISKNSLGVLNKRGIQKSRVYLFVANLAEKKIYQQQVESHLYGHIIVGKLGLRNQRNFITQYFKEGQMIVEMDDDIGEIYRLQAGKEKKDNKLLELTNLDHFFKDAFHRLLSHTTSLEKSKYSWNKRGGAQKPQAHLWGIYPVDNPYFMQSRITDDLRFIVGPLWGKINRHAKNFKLTIDEKEDVERTLQHYVKDGSVFRFNNVTIKTTYYKTKGGMQSENKDRQKEALTSAKYLVKKYPSLTTLYLKKKSGHPEVRLRDKVSSKK